MKYRGSATGGLVGMNSWTLESSNGSTAMVEVSVPPALKLWGFNEVAYMRWGPAVAQISVNHAVNCEVFAGAVVEVKDMKQGTTKGVYTNSFYSPQMRKVSFGVYASPHPKPGYPADPWFCSALANVFRFTEDTEVTQTVPAPPPYSGGGWF